MPDVRARVMPDHDDPTACSIGLDNFVEAMGEKLAAARKKGRGGWNNPDECLLEEIAALLLEAVTDGDLVSIGNFAMMLHARDPQSAPLEIRGAFMHRAAEFARDALTACIVEKLKGCNAE